LPAAFAAHSANTFFARSIAIVLTSTFGPSSLSDEYSQDHPWPIVRPLQSGRGSIPSFNSKLRDECLNEHVFLSLAEARQTIEAWRYDHNHLRPYGSLGALTPSEFAMLKGEETQPPQEVKLQPTLLITAGKLGGRPLGPYHQDNLSERKHNKRRQDCCQKRPNLISLSKEDFF
jgi:hypothetical protein